MVEFGRELANSRREAWKNEYVDYDRLKAIIKQEYPQSKNKKNKPNKKKRNKNWMSDSDLADVAQLAAQQAEEEGQKSLSLLVFQEEHDTTNDGGKSIFRQALDQEIEKVVLFLLEHQGTLASTLRDLSHEKQSLLLMFQAAAPASMAVQSTSPTSVQQQQQPSAPNNYLSESVVTSLKDNMKELVFKYRDVGNSILEFVTFVELNVTAVRKILKKHDKICTPKHKKLSQIYLSTVLLSGEGFDGGSNGNGRSGLLLRRGDSMDDSLDYDTDDGDNDSYYGNHQDQNLKIDDSHLHQLYHYGGLSALVATLQSSFAQLRHLEMTLNRMLVRSARRRHSSAPLQLTALEEQEYSHHSETEGFDEDDDNIHEGPTPISRTRKQEGTQIHPFHRTAPNMSTSITRARRLSSSEITGPMITVKHEPVLDMIHIARRRLRQSTKYVEVIAAQALMFDKSELEGDDYSTTMPLRDQHELLLEEDKRRGGRTSQKERRAQNISSFLNLTSTFLYMTNYYIVAPTCGQYASKLGSSEAFAGIIIGMTPNAALLATVLYGWWSNYSYKSALIFAATSSWVGNICYAMALHYNSLTLVLIGRFCNGFGSARSINRRFIADTFSKRERTAASAAFVTAGALGMAVGPAIAAILGHLHVDPSVNYDTDGGIHTGDIWTVETSPGWVMLGLWTMFLVGAIGWFEEPDRSHIFKPTGKIVEVVMDGGASETLPLLSSTNGDATNGGSMLVALNHSDSTASSRRSTATPIYKNVPVMMTLWIYFVLKLVLEILLSSSSTLTRFYFNWNAQSCGTYLAFLGLLMFPANMVVARLSNTYDDREMIYITLILMFFSVCGAISYSSPAYSFEYSEWHYMFFGICIFITSNSLEGPNMSLLSKTIPREWAKGTFNSGFLATEAGTGARSVGDLLISGVATWLGVKNMLNGTMIPLAGLILLTIVLTKLAYPRMIEIDEDDDDDDDVTASVEPTPVYQNGVPRG